MARWSRLLRLVIGAHVREAVRDTGSDLVAAHRDVDLSVGPVMLVVTARGRVGRLRDRRRGHGEPGDQGE